VTLLTVSHLAKSYAGVPALKAASLDLEAGEVLAIMGENGAGKSTLIKCLAGATQPDSGEIILDGKPVKITGPDHAQALGFRFIHQELNIVPQLSVAENIFLGRDYPRRVGAFVNWSKLNARAREALAVLGLDKLDPRRIMAGLSTGDRMLVKIAAAFLDQDGATPRMFVMDEPTAALTGEETDRLFQLIDALRARGCGILYVSHRMDEVMRIATRITVLRDGATRATVKTSSTTKFQVIELMTGRRVSDSHPPQTSGPCTNVLLAIEHLSDAGLNAITLQVREGEILGLAGLAGSGQGHVLKSLMGSARRARVTLDGKPLRLTDPASSWAQGIAYVPRERRVEGLILSHSVSDNVTLPHLGVLSRMRLFLNRRAERRAVGHLVSRVRLKSAGLSQRVWRLSGGNQQKVVLARAILGKPRLLLLDEPTRGVDVGAKFDIHTLLREIAATGTAIILSSSDLDELLGMTDRIAVLRLGTIVTIVPSAGLTPSGLLDLCYGVTPVKDEHANST
jgi:ABC-type sugar transport system ATPase subunit